MAGGVCGMDMLVALLWLVPFCLSTSCASCGVDNTTAACGVCDACLLAYGSLSGPSFNSRIVDELR